jgi:hypothetical protein
MLAPAIAACSSDLGLSNVTFAAPKSEAPARKPDWTTYSGSTPRPVTPQDLVDANGQCVGTADVAAPAPGEPVLPAGIPTVQGSIVLQMTECDVVRRAGQADKVEFGANERGERSAVLTFSRGPWPGIYRFAAGRLYSIERLPTTAPSAEPAPARPGKTTKKPLGT